MFLTAGFAFASLWLEGFVEKVSDGDTIRLMSGGEIKKIRFYGIDAPESKQEFGDRARFVLDSLIAGKQVKVKVIDTDRYRRLVAEVWLDSLELSYWMVANGYARWYQSYGKDRKDLARAEQEAKIAKKGLWAAENPEAPWDYRARQKKKTGSRKKK